MNECLLTLLIRQAFWVKMDNILIGKTDASSFSQVILSKQG